MSTGTDGNDRSAGRSAAAPKTTKVTAGRSSPAARRGSISVPQPRRAAWEPDRRTAFVVGVLGNGRTAELLGVSKSQPSRWKTAAEVPAPVTASRLIDLDAVLAKLVLLWDRSLADAWLTGSNPYLDGARPIDVLAMAGAADVLRAIDEEASGAYA